MEQRTPRSLKRIAILAAIFIMLAVTLIPTLRSYLHQQSEIAALQAKVAAQRDSVAALREEEAQWSDPAFVEQQARERLKLVRPGEKSYTVIDAEPSAAGEREPQVAAPSSDSSGTTPWYGRLWQSMVIADTPPKATRIPLPSHPK